MNELVPFHLQRRQQFLSKAHYLWALDDARDGITNVQKVIEEALSKRDYRYAGDSASFQGLMQFQRLCVRYTAGESIEPLRDELGQIVATYERYGDLLWKYRQDRNEVVFEFTSLDDYCQLMQLIGLCFLLHRRDLLPRLAALQDGVSAIGQLGQGNGGSDWLFEEFMSFGIGADKRFESDQLCCSKPYEALADAMSSADNSAALKDLDRFLKHWYKDLVGTAWHDSHKPDEEGNQGGYYGYWSFEAGAAVLLLGIEDDSSLHKYLYYPKDMVAWAREHAALSEGDHQVVNRLRCEGGQPCPRAGFWSTPASHNSRRRFDAGEVMPVIEGSSWGATIWYWDEAQG